MIYHSLYLCWTCLWKYFVNASYEMRCKNKIIVLYCIVQEVKTQMKYSIMLHFIRVYAVCKGKNILRQTKTIVFAKYNPAPLGMYNRLSQSYCIKSEVRIHLYTKGKRLHIRLWCPIVSFSLSHWYPGSGVVLDCIDSWSLPSFLHLNQCPFQFFRQIQMKHAIQVLYCAKQGEACVTASCFQVISVNVLLLR